MNVKLIQYSPKLKKESLLIGVFEISVLNISNGIKLEKRKSKDFDHTKIFLIYKIKSQDFDHIKKDSQCHLLPSLAFKINKVTVV